METGLSELVAIHEKYPIFDGYSEKLTIEELKDFVRFLKAIGVMYQLEITHLNKYPALRNPNNPYIWNKCNWTETGHIEDYSIKNLVDYLRENSVLASRLVWNAIINSDNRRVQVAGFQPNRTHDYKEVDSLLIYMLKNYDWIPTKSGEFRNPQAMTRDDLPDDFPFNNSNGLLTAIEFGHNEKNRLEQQRKLREQESEEYKQIDSLAKKIGLDSGDEMRESAEFYKKMKSQGKLDEIKKLLDSEQPDFSEDSSSNPSRRFEKLKEDAINSPKKLKEMRQRSVSDGEYEKVKQRAKEYLKDRYTINDVLYCQICKKEMPFKLSDGSYYFEAVSLINDAEKSFIYNFIALCPVDAAKFKFANTSRKNMKTLIKEIIENRTPEEINNNKNGKNYIELVLADNSEVIEFTPKHLGDIKSTLDD
jgi:uncharacterized protein (DUF305 family)